MTINVNDPENTEARAGESSEERIARLLHAGKIARNLVGAAERYWHERLRNGIAMPNGEMAIVSMDDVYHLIVDPRIARKPWRIKRLLMGIDEIRTADAGRRRGFGRWEEDGMILLGSVILEADSSVRTMHLVDARKMQKLRQRGTLLWKP